MFADLDQTPNRIEQARLQALAEAGYLDLTSSNPTHQGLVFPADILRRAAESYWANRRYDPNPRGLLAAREAIVRYYAGRSPALVISPDDVFVTASTSEAYSLLFALLTEPGDNVLAPQVTYPLFEYLAALHHVTLRPYLLDESNGWQIDPDSLHMQADARTRAILIVSPHNPTGMIVQQSIAALDDLGLPIICDEVFAPFTYAAPATPPLGALHPILPAFHLNGISKLFGLPDLKLGWIALHGAVHAQAERLELLNDTFLSCSPLIQTMLPTLFREGEPFIQQMRQRISANLDLAIATLRSISALHAPDGGYYLFPRVDSWQDEEALVIAALKQGVLVHPGYFYDYEQGTHIMLSCLTEPATFVQGLQRLAEVIRRGC